MYIIGLSFIQPIFNELFNLFSFDFYIWKYETV